MTTATAVTPTRRRFRRAVAALAALGVVALGLVPVSAAYAANGHFTATILDSDDNPLTAQMLLEPEGGLSTSATPDSNGQLDMYLPAGTYTLSTFFDERFPYWEHTFVVEDDQTTPLGTFKLDQYPSVAGSVSPALGAGGYVNTHRWNEDDGSWSHVGGPRYIASDGTFQMWFGDASSSTWTLEFVPVDGIPYMTTFLGGGGSRPNAPTTGSSFTLGDLNDVDILGQTELIGAGIVTGTVKDLGGEPIEDAYVVAADLDGDDLAETRTDGTGAYTMKVPLDEELTVRAYADDRLTQFYNGTYYRFEAEVLQLGTGNLEKEDVDFELAPDNIEVSFDIYADQGSGPEPYEVNAWLYHASDSGFSPVPFDIDWEDDTVRFEGLPPGAYRLGLQLADESGWIPFSVTNTAPGDDALDAAEDCYYSFEIYGDEVELAFDATADPASTDCIGAPWLDGAGSPGVVTGTVDDIDDMDGPVIATLYIGDEYGEPIEVLSSTVDDNDGTFTLPGVYVEGQYFVGIEVGRTDPFMETLFGDDADDEDRMPMWLLYDQFIDGFWLEGGQGEDMQELSLFPAAVLTGTVTLRDQPVEDVCVSLEDVDSNDDVMCDTTDGDGRYYLKAPVPDDPNFPLEYRIYAYPDGAYLWTYYGEDWFNGDIIQVSEPGLDLTQYDIELVTFPSFIVGSATIWDDDTYNNNPVSGGVAHLYKKLGSNWVEVEAFTLIHDFASSDFVFPGSLFDELNSSDPNDIRGLSSLAPGDYRIYFSQGGTWLPIEEYDVEQYSLPDHYQETDTYTTVCYVSVPGFALDTVALVGVYIDTESTLNCAPPTPPVITPTNPPTPSGGTPPRFVPPILDHDPIEFPDDEGEDETPEPSPSPTSTPTPSPTPDPTADGGSDADGLDLTWLWWSGGILMLIIIAGGTVLIIRRP